MTYLYYKDRIWQPCIDEPENLRCEGDYVEVAPDTWVHRLNIKKKGAACISCKRRNFSSSYQTLMQETMCERCYEDADKKQFGGWIWHSWEGMIYLADMADTHLVAALGLLDKRADAAADRIGASREACLPRIYEEIIKELYNRKPAEDRVKVNHFLIMLLSILLPWLAIQEKPCLKS